MPLKPWTLPSSYSGATWEDYLMAPVGRNRDSDLATESNFEAQLKVLRALDFSHWDFDEPPFQVVSENHWACGWVEWVAIDSRATQAITAMEKLAARLDQYPLLDEDDVSMREYEAACESFDRYSVQELAGELGDAFELKARTVERIKQIDPAKVLEFALDKIGFAEIYAEGGGASFIFNDPASEYTPINRHDLAAFLFSNRH